MNPPVTLNETVLRRKLRSVPGNVLRSALLLYVIFTDRHTPLWVRALVLAALMYLINPLDTIPDALPGIGFIDDLAVMAIALERLSRFLTQPVEERVKRLMPMWFAERPEATKQPPTTNEKGDPYDGSQEQKHDGRGTSVPYIERFRILP